VLPGAPTDLEDAAVAWCAGQGQEACQEIQPQPKVELELEPQAEAQDELEPAAAAADVTVPPASNVVAFRPPAQARPASGFHLVDDAPAVPAPVVVLPPRGQVAAAGERAAAAPAEPVVAEPVEPTAAVATPAWVAPVPEPEPLAAVPEGFSAPSPVSEPVAAEPALLWEAPAPVAPAASPEPAATAPATSELPWEAPAPSAPAAPTVSTAPAAVPCRPSTAHPAAEPAGPFELPDPGIFHRNAAGFQQSPEQQREAAEMAERLQSALNEFGVKAEVVDWVQGPSCTTYMVNPGEGVRVSKFTALEDDIARVLARTSVRVYAPVPNTSYVGIEVSALNRQSVAFGDVLPYVDGGPLDLAIGLDAEGKPVHSDLAKLPHLLVSGTTGSGKSVLMNTLIMSLLMRNTPADVRLIMVDPKQVEFTVYNGIPHLVMPVVADPRQAAAALQWGVTEMDRRYRLFSNLGVRDLAGYNRLVDSDAFAMSEFPPQHLPAVVVFIDELADLMMVAKKDVEASIVRIAQLGRASGIHLVIATQSPRADVVTGLIRANIANRIALRVSKNMESRIIIDQNGAEKLLPRGDMLFLEAGWSDKPRRIQGCYLADSEIEQVVAHLKEQDGTQYNSSMAPLPGSQPQASFDDGLTSAAGGSGSAEGDRGDEPMAWAAAKIVVDTQVGSTSMLQRRLKTGYARAGRLMDMLEEMGVVGPAKGSKPRDVLIRDLDELSTLRGGFDDIEEDY
jgi:S-DNA-T family DNA segregation ATPase FtsK/SpoIIIE